MRRYAHQLREEEGYTLTEFGVAMAVFLVFMSLATPFMFSQLRSALETEDSVELQQTARGALRTIVSELRQAEALYQSSEKPTGRNRISFGIDLDGNGTITSYQESSQALEQVTYFHAGDTLYRGRRQGQGVPLAEGVTAVTFTMFGSNPVFDSDGDGVVSEDELNTNGNVDGSGDPIWETAELANVTRVRVSLVVGDDDPQTYSADAWLRNRVSG